MSKNKSQSGSARLIIIISIVVVALGVAGFIFWQNESNSTGLTEIATDSTVGTNLAIKYPKAWSVTQSSRKYQSKSIFGFYKANITSPDNKIAVEFGVSDNAKLALGECTATAPTITQLSTDVVAGYPKVRFVSYIMNNKSFGGDGFYIGLQENTESVNSVKVGDSNCGFIGSQIITADSNSANFTLNIKLNDVANNSKTLVADVNKAMTTDSFKVAKQIVQSLYVK